MPVANGTLDKCRHCGQKIRWGYPPDNEEVSYRIMRWYHTEPFEGTEEVRVAKGEPKEFKVVTYYLRCNKKYVPKEKQNHWRLLATPQSYCVESVQSQSYFNDTCNRKIVDQSLMMCGIHARPRRKAEIEAEERRKAAAERAEREAINEWRRALIQADVDKLPKELNAAYYGFKDNRKVVVNLDALLTLLRIEV